MTAVWLLGELAKAALEHGPEAVALVEELTDTLKARHPQLRTEPIADEASAMRAAQDAAHERLP